MSELLFPELLEDLGGDDGTEHYPHGISVQACRGCGCSEYDPCETEHGACFWFEPDLCSACARGD